MGPTVRAAVGRYSPCPMAPPDGLSTRALNRATLERQFLLERASVAPLDAVRHLVGLQAQEPLDPYLGLWSRLDRFDPESLARLMVDRAVVRIVVMRGTIHLVTPEDAVGPPTARPAGARPRAHHASRLRARAARHRSHTGAAGRAAPCSRRDRSPPPSCAPPSPSTSPPSTPRHSRTRAATTSRSCRCHRADSGVSGARCG